MPYTICCSRHAKHMRERRLDCIVEATVFLICLISSREKKLASYRLLLITIDWQRVQWFGLL